MSDSSIRSLAARLPYSIAIGIACYVGIAAVGLTIRIAKMRQFVGHIDEPASLLAIQRVAETGLPMFPSGVLYLQGAVFSYLAAPLAWVFSDTGLWRASIVLHLILALTIIPLSMKLVSYISGSLWAATFVGVLVACDPSLIHWSVAIRPSSKLSINDAWRNKSFRNYADYMQTDAFAAGLEELVKLAEEKTTAIMCAEAVPWRCHRSLVSDALLARGIESCEIISDRSERPHKMTSFAVVNGTNITYPKSALPEEEQEGTEDS